MRLVFLDEQVQWAEGSKQVVNRNTANLTLAKGLQARIACLCNTCGVLVCSKQSKHPRQLTLSNTFFVVVCGV